ncbi:ribonuclease R [Tissierella creatinophila]|uniref:Ribonuclease R n=1 Tax=Tissierella creatinophila DSM 6911 TaxID=1123403 RepID=A0A1U7M918_TISCR|nr:ribonuclease R [Tissierella creatinophila]OLS03834.1 ribonuclease R [Tissierella creatinophila DSM 6911]
MSIKEKIIELMSQKDYKPMLKEELLVKFDIPIEFKKEFFKVLKDLEKEGTIIKSANERYGKIDTDYLVVGKLQGHERGFGFVIPEEKENPDVYISAEAMNGAMHGDKVVANVIKRSEGGKRQEGEIIRILERKNQFIVGTFEDNQNFGFLIPDNQKIFHDVFIPKGHTNGAKNGQKIVVEITQWPERRRNPEGKVAEILGYPDETGTDVLSIIRQFDLPEEFPEKVIRFAQNIEDRISEDDIKDRKDLRRVKTFTIDGADAKDLDDAISIEKLENGNYSLGVHIADVSHYVREGTPLDKESYRRGNSVYLVDRVIPMLPKELSNGICSLNPNVDRLCLSVIMEIDKSGKVLSHEIVETVINSDKRLIYEDVSNYLEDNDEEAREKLDGILEEINLMEELMHILKSQRENRGSIDFNFPETQIILDERGKPIDIKKADRRIANRMIEEFMLITNETVAEQFFWAEIPFLYRIHEQPSEERMATFSKFIYNLGYKLKGKEIHPKDLQMLTEEIEGKKEELVISTMMLRSLKKAKYSMDQDIHFGLAAKYYSHFTAPIRRYPDLVIHRIIKDFIKGEMSTHKQEILKANLPEIAEHTSYTERLAEEAEREVQDLKMTQYMSERIGEEYEGIISSLTNFGMFVQLENTIEGLVPFSQMLDDYYQFDEENLKIVGERTKKEYNLGDKVKIEVVGADIVRRNIDFQLVV